LDIEFPLDFQNAAYRNFDVFLSWGTNIGRNNYYFFFFENTIFWKVQPCSVVAGAAEIRWKKVKEERKDRKLSTDIV